MVAVANAVAEGHINVVPEVLVTGGGALDGLAATLMRTFATSRPAALAPLDSRVADTAEEPDEGGEDVAEEIDDDAEEVDGEPEQFNDDVDDGTALAG